jgi:hypothetical protein
VDGLAGILVLLGLDLPCVVLPAHRPAELGGLVPVHLLAGELGGKGRLGGRGEGRGAGEEGSEDDELVLSQSNEKQDMLDPWTRNSTTRILILSARACSP